MSAAGAWRNYSKGPLDFFYLPSSMGQAPALALGVALARPERGVIVVNGEGSLLMNLGCLVTLAHHPASLYMLVIDNGLYEVTGGQPTAGGGHADFAGLARAAGIERTYTFSDAADWRKRAGEVLSGPGPVVAWMKVEGRLGQETPKPVWPMTEQVARFQAALQA
jgi:thiamine pyrophosphate-dependent acetolactate synthase large subunit-like protein